jgi:hypothetical protein
MRQLSTGVQDPGIEERVRRLERQVTSLTATVRRLEQELPPPATEHGVPSQTTGSR